MFALIVFNDNPITHCHCPIMNVDRGAYDTVIPADFQRKSFRDGDAAKTSSSSNGTPCNVTGFNHCSLLICC